MQAATEQNTPEPAPPRPKDRDPLTPSAAIRLAIAFGLAAGYLDVLVMLFLKYVWNEDHYFWTGRDFPWSVPVAHAALLLVPGLILAVVARRRPGLISPRAGVWLLATLALWGVALRLPIHGAAGLLLAAGLARLIGETATAPVLDPRRARPTLAGLLGVLAVLAALSSGRQMVREWRAEAALPPPPPGARNVVLIVWDTVRAASLSTYGYPRRTTPNLTRLAREGVLYTFALAPAPWTFPSHTSFFTGHWPHRLNSQWKHTLDAPYPTLAEFLASRGYQTAGFAANTSYCSYESGLDRGFTHYEDYPLTPLSLLGRTAPGRWVAEHLLNFGDYHGRKWVLARSRDAAAIDGAFLGWLGRRRPDRPFFAFLNYLDAHDPYVPPAEYVGRFGVRPRSSRDYEFLLRPKLSKAKSVRDISMARDAYDCCIAYLDDQLGRLLDELKGRGLLENTVVVITSDHGEAFGAHGVFGHATSVYLEEVGVPLVILAPGAPSRAVVTEPVSLRDLPATVVDQLGLTRGSPFPGRSLAAHWRRAGSEVAAPATTPALSELAHEAAFRPQDRRGLEREGFQMSLVARGRHYVRDGNGSEQLYNLRSDPMEMANLMESPSGRDAAPDLRRDLLRVLTENPGSIEVEDAYLKPYRQWLESLVGGEPASDAERPPGPRPPSTAGGM